MKRGRSVCTLALIKPDITTPSLVQAISSSSKKASSSPEYLSTLIHEGPDTPLTNLLRMIERDGFKIIERRWIDHWTIEEAEEFYREHEGRFFFQRLIAFMTSGPLIPMVLEKENAIQDWRKLMGPTHIERAKKEDPTSLRAHFATSDTRNATHGSDSEETARREIDFFFPTFYSKESSPKSL